jgi:MFS family permease
LLEARPGTEAHAQAPRRPAWAWVHVAVAAGAMVATLPGRTHGLGLITEPLRADLHLGEVAYGAINFWATLLGAAFCLPVGWLLDRLGTRGVLAANLVLLGGVVVLMSRVGTAGVVPVLFLLVLLTRGFGQSALSVVSLALFGKSAGPRPGIAMGVYSFVVGLGFMAAFALCKVALEAWSADWRTLWAGIGFVLLAGAPLAWLLVRPAAVGWAAAPPGEAAGPGPGATLGQALATPAFWVFALGTSLYGLVAAGVSLFNQSILAERQFDRGVFLSITTLMPLVGLASNLATGWLAGRWSPGRLLCLALLLVSAALLAFPLVRTLPQVYLYAITMGVAGGMVTVIFFGVWGQAFGPAHLGKIQGAAQLLTVLASALGPWLLAAGHEWAGSYAPVFRYIALACGLLGLAAWWVPLPKPAAPTTA